MELLDVDTEAGMLSTSRQDSRKGCRCKHRLKGDQLLTVLILAGVVAGVVLGIGVKTSDPSPQTITLFTFPGQIFMNMLKMLIMPIVTTSIISGVSSLNIKRSGRIGIHAIVFYILTSVLAVVLGLVLALSMRPGSFGQTTEDVASDDVNGMTLLNTLLDFLRNIFPDNIIVACFESARTVAEDDEEKSVNENETNLINSTAVDRSNTTVQMVRGTNLLGLIMFSVAFGLALSSEGDSSASVTSFFNGLNNVFLKLIRVAMWYSPVGVCSLIAGTVLRGSNIAEIMKTLGMYVVVAITGYAIHGLVVLPFIFWIIKRQNPYKLFPKLAPMITTAFGTSSSAATLPVTIRCMENKVGIDKRIARFILPIGATVNMDGTAMLQAIAAVTISQMCGIKMSPGQLATTCAAATLASIGTAAVPGSGLVALLVVLTAVGLPTDPVSVLWAVDWLLDRLRVIVNIYGDCVGASVIQHLNRNMLKSEIPEACDLDGRREIPQKEDGC